MGPLLGLEVLPQPVRHLAAVPASQPAPHPRHGIPVRVDGNGAIPSKIVEAAAEWDNVAFAHSGWPLSRLLQVDSLEGVLYVGNRTRNFRAVKLLPEAAHVFIGHGHSAKAGSSARVATLYDAVLVAGYTDVDRWTQAVQRRLRPRALAIGAPVVPGLRATAGRLPRTRPPRVLYLPTWEGHTRRTRIYCSTGRRAPGPAGPPPGG